MHRLLKLPNNQLEGFIKFSNCGNNCAVSRIRTLDNFNKSDRSYATKPEKNVSSNKPKRKRRIKNYVELLVVTENSSQEQKAPVKRLNPRQLKALVENDFNLSLLYKCNPTRTIEEHTYNNLTIIDTIFETNKPHSSELNNSENEATDLKFIPNSISLIKSFENEIPVSTSADFEDFTGIANYRKFGTFQPDLAEEEPLECHAEEEKIEEEKVVKSKNYFTQVNEEISSQTLAAYVEVCSNLRDPQRGLNAVIFHRTQSVHNPTNFSPLKYVNIYNSLLRSFAVKGNLKKIQEVLKMAAEDNIKLDAQSYANIFECLGRINIKDSALKYIRIYVKEMKSKGLTFDDVINNAIFTSEQKKFVLEVMQAYDPLYKPDYKTPKLQYINNLVNSLNDDIQLRPPEKDEFTEGAEGIFNKEQMNKLVEQQLETEKNGYVVIKSIQTKNDITENVQWYRKMLSDHYKMWEEAALEGFNRDIAALSARRSTLNLEPYLRSIPVRDFVSIMVEEAKKLAEGSETYSPTVNQLYKDMGNKVYAKYKVLCKQKSGVLDKVVNIHKEYCNEYANEHKILESLPDSEKKFNSRQRWQWTEWSLQNAGASSIVDHNEWVPTVLSSIGKFLYHIIMYDFKVDVNSMKPNKHKNLLPAFYTIFRNQGRITKEEVKPHPVLSRLYRSSEPETLTFAASDVPMKCPPVPWVSVKTGGYLIAPCETVRLPSQAYLQKQRLAKADPRSLYPSLDSLNQLSAVPWKVNEKILDVILEVFNSGGSQKLDVPQPPEALSLPSQDVKDYKLPSLRQRLQFKRKQAEMYSLWCDCLYRLSLANHYRKDIFWLPHNMDFRGRVYPIPPHLNHLGSDLARSMLIFAEGRPLGPKGLDWLKIHLVNLTGLKKRDSIDERLIFANKIMDKILDSADNPLTGKKWWAESEEPWQTLACCLEIAAAHRSPDPEQYLSHFPVHQDGSCNGLQHYAALGRDSAGAYSVNLTASAKPQDVYSAVVALVEQQRVKDAEVGVPIAKVLEGFVHRKVIKQTVMTTVYGVTRFGARLQIARQLKDLENFPKEHVWSASHYLTTKTFESLRCMFTSTREIQDWFTECARLISSVSGKNVEWVTPLGLPVVQPYNRHKKLPSVSPVYENFHMDKFEKPNVMKQKNAFPPNFIHSLDSSHMMLTSLYCERAGITFVSVHDCYWTHPSTVHIMNKICREQFVALHSQPILENLSLFLSEAYTCTITEKTDTVNVQMKRRLNKVLRNLPKTSDFDIREVLNSIYFFS